MGRKRIGHCRTCNGVGRVWATMPAHLTCPECNGCGTRRHRRRVKCPYPPCPIWFFQKRTGKQRERHCSASCAAKHRHWRRRLLGAVVQAHLSPLGPLLVEHPDVGTPA